MVRVKQLGVEIWPGSKRLKDLRRWTGATEAQEQGKGNLMERP